MIKITNQQVLCTYMYVCLSTNDHQTPESVWKINNLTSRVRTKDLWLPQGTLIAFKLLISLKSLTSSLRTEFSHQVPSVVMSRAPTTTQNRIKIALESRSMFDFAPPHLSARKKKSQSSEKIADDVCGFLYLNELITRQPCKFLGSLTRNPKTQLKTFSCLTKWNNKIKFLENKQKTFF